MDSLARKIDIPLARNIIKEAGLFLVSEKRFDELAELSVDAYQNYPLHNWLTNGVYDSISSKLLMKATLASMKNDAVIYADSEELNGFAVWLPQGFTGNKPLPFICNGGVRLVLHGGLGFIRKLLIYESFAMKLKEKYTGHDDWYLFNLSVRQSAQGKGIASKLMYPMLHFCKDKKMMVYLETNKEENVPMYCHYGFELKEATVIPGSSVEHYCMVCK